MNQKELLRLDDELRVLIKSIVPDDAEFGERRFESTRKSYIYDISWKLNNDTSKRSKIIRVVISKKALEWYEQGGVSKKEEYQKKLIKFIDNKYRNFNPDHDMDPPPTEEWLVTSDIFK